MGGAKKISWPVKELDFLRQYGIRDLYLKGEHRSVLHLGNGTKAYALKCVNYAPEKLMFLAGVQQFMEVRGFANFARMVPNLAGEYFVKIGQENYCLMEWIPGRESAFKDHNDLFTYISVVANLHKLTRGFGGEPQNLSEKWSGSLQELKAGGERRFSGELHNLLSRAIEFGQIALSFLQKPEVLKSACRSLVVCHKDLTYRNLLIDANNQGYLIDFDYAKADRPVRDLAQFLRKAWKQNAWDTDLGLRLLAFYAKDNLLTNGDLGLLLAYLYFPRSLRQFASRMKKYASNPVLVEDTIQDVKSYLANKPSLERFSRSLGY